MKWIPMATCLFACALTAQGEPTAKWLDAATPGLIETYKHFHRNPEVSFREIQTSKRLAEELAKTGAQVSRNVGKLGVVAVLENGPGPTLMLRADMDALPIGERTGLDYMSKIRKELDDGRVQGVMHACGHDVHMTVLIGTTQFLAAHKELWSGTLLCIGQPAEERGAGAKAMLDDGLFERFALPDFALALHVTSDLAAGRVGYRAGPVMANVDSVDITMFGRGGHGATPHVTIDPIVQASQLVLQLQTIVSREIEPIQPAVITVGAIQAGTKHNIISDRCDLQLTVRSMTDEVRAHIHAAIIRKAKAIAMGAGAPEPKVEFSEGTPSLSNDPQLTARVADVFRKTLGADNVVEVDQVMTGEDFARYGRAGVPIFMFRLGTIAPTRLARYAANGEPSPGLHSAGYYPDPAPSLRTGVRAMSAAALALCPRTSGR